VVEEIHVVEESVTIRVEGLLGKANKDETGDVVAGCKELGVYEAGKEDQGGEGKEERHEKGGLIYVGHEQKWRDRR
jgi:hypothetical protein